MIFKMKKIVSFFLLLLSFTFCFAKAPVNPISWGLKTLLNYKLRFDQNWTVSEYGFMIYPTATDLESFLTFLQTKTHAQAQSYLSGLSFSSLGATLYAENTSTQTLTYEEAIDYSMNIKRVLQVEGILIKPVSQSANCESVKWEFVLAMSVSRLDENSYYSFSRGIYDGNVMNKYATNPPASDTSSLPCKMGISNSGHEDTQANSCPENLSDKRPFWGPTQYTCTQYTGPECWNPVTNTPGVCYTYCPPRYYVFWICVTNCGSGACTAMQSGAPCPPTQY